MTSFCKIFALKEEDIINRLIGIYEDRGASGNFCISLILQDLLSKKDDGVIFLSLHNTYDHYFHAGLRLGYNLHVLQEQFEFISVDDADLKSTIKNLILKMENLKAKFSRVHLILDSVNDLVNIGASEKDVMIFVRYLKNLTEFGTIVTLAQYTENFDIFKHHLSRIADINLDFKPLKTGAAKDVSGSVQFYRKKEDSLDRCKDSTLYHYKLSSRNVKIFHPGNII